MNPVETSTTDNRTESSQNVETQRQPSVNTNTIKGYNKNET